MTDKLDLSLPNRQTAATDSVSKAGIIINLMILAGICAILVVLFLKNGRNASVESSDGLPAEAQKQVALKLEKQGLNRVAASAWEKYLAVGTPKKDDSAKIWFRIGKLLQEEHAYDQALSAYYRSEQFSKLPEISTEISRRVQECLESMGKFAALRDELADRVGLSQPAADPYTERQTVVVEIGSQKITVSDIDHEIEKVIDRQLSRMASFMTEDDINQQKEALLKQFSGTQQRLQFLNQFLAQEILYREARASDFIDDPAVRSEIRDQERALLAGRQIEKAYAENIKITPTDLTTYYEAHKDEYTDTESGQQKSFDDVRNEVYSALRASKEQEVREALLKQLKDKYDVVIHASVLSSEEKPSDSTNTVSKAK